jgi:von Willebrand factor
VHSKLCYMYNQVYHSLTVSDETFYNPPAPTPCPPFSICDVCPSIVLEKESECPRCPTGQLSDGQRCIPKNNCTCINDDIKYPVGAGFKQKDCRKCTCTEGGVQKCDDFECPRCEKADEHSVKINDCECICKPCPTGSRICPNSRVCVREEKWCDGTLDCNDDEINCSSKTCTYTVSF